MTAIWHHDGNGWQLLAPAGFPDEATLHDLIADAPQLLPLAGAPPLVIAGREVQLGSGYADLVAVEPARRLAIIEVKLARNAEARRAVVAQVLTYAAYLQGLDLATLEEGVLARHLRERGAADLASLIASQDQTGTFEPGDFREALAASVRAGQFRLVIVLDDAPAELVQLVGYLATIAPGVLIDLVTVTAYSIGGAQALVPRRIEPERPVRDSEPKPPPPPPRGRLVSGAEDFAATIPDAPADAQPVLRRLGAWARSLEAAGWVTLATYHGVAQRWTLLPRLRDDTAGLVTIWHDHGAYLSLNRSVFERRAPASLSRIEALIAPTRLGQGTTTRAITEVLLAALTDAHREAAGAITPPEDA